MLSLAQKFDVATITVLASSDDTGFGYINAFQKSASLYNTTVVSPVTYNQTTPDGIKLALEQIIKNGVKTVFIQTVDNAALILFPIVSKLGMLNGDYWIVLSSSFDETVFTLNDMANMQKNALEYLEISIFHTSQNLSKQFI
jgi:hypothetical protein